MIDNITCREIDKVVAKTLKDAGLTQPPIRIEDFLDYLEVNRDFYDLEDPNLLKRFWHKVKVEKKRLIKVVRKIKLAAVWLPNEEQILVDSSLPAPKQEWASFHDAIHTMLEWHRPFFLGDTARTLDPDFQEMLENEANYGASAVMFGGKNFTKEALDTVPSWESIEALKKRYQKSFVTTLRRYVAFSHKQPMTMMVSLPWWMSKPAGQERPWRHYIGSRRFMEEFGSVTPNEVLIEIDSNTIQRKGGPVGEFDLWLSDTNGDKHKFYAESFFNRHYLLTLIVHQHIVT